MRSRRLPPAEGTSEMSGDQHFTTADGCRIAYRIDGPVDRPVLMLSNSIATNL
ncbi:hypothetical protein chiPu_0033515, partial [Chiloscyllium punctatum]|nr:hypothetical protein [Chiloscyllium punctatum]